ncbi:MAG: Serine/threonine-protein kinase PknD [Phycisphaerae bacterium]|nr:Serine/threonine-protein kinase PknD [Phycisphaerae bacterium]
MVVDRSRWAEVKRIFHEALEQTPEFRASFILAQCGDDAYLMNEVHSLLAAYLQSDGFLEKPAFAAWSSPSDGDVSVVDRTRTMDLNSESAIRVAGALADLIPDYELMRVCGHGAFGKVWIARDRVGVYRALKVIELGKLTELGITHREIRALQQYCQHVPLHPNLVQIFHIGQGENMFYYTMELADDAVTRLPVRKELPGSYIPMTLRRVLRAGRLNVDVAVEITLHLLKGLECLHQAGLVHRDIKPANIIFANREVKLADVSLVDMTRTQMSQVGTPQYMPPDEQMDATADTYALGKVLHEMITNKNMTSFPRLPEELPISSTQLDIGKLDSFLVKACGPNAKARYPSATEMRSALLRCRFPLIDAPLLELANEEMLPSPDDSLALAALQRVVGDADGGTVGSKTTAVSIKSVPQIRSATPGERMVWAVVDRIIRLVPWLVILVLGLYLIRRLT